MSISQKIKDWFLKQREAWKEFLRLMADPNFLNAMTSAETLLGIESKETEGKPSD